MIASEVKIGATYKAALRDKVRRVKILEMIVGRENRVGWKAEDVENGAKELFISSAKQLSPARGGAREGSGPKPKRLMRCGWGCGAMLSKTGKNGIEQHFEVCPKRPREKRA
jgi:hypothetical protein